jgi:deoxyribonuclease-1
MSKIFVGAYRSGCLLLLSLVLSGSVHAEKLNDFDQVASNTFWSKLYPGGGWSLYCGYKFSAAKKTGNGLNVGIEHIYPSSSMTLHADCSNRMQCRDSGNEKFIRMEADLHNMYPVTQALITYRSNYRYGLINGEDWRFEDCDLEWKSGVIEPRQIARGNIARAMLYMHKQYNIPVSKNNLVLFKVWNRIDPPSLQEKKRNDIIERLQGNRNPYIDTPKLAEKQKLTMLK